MSKDEVLEKLKTCSENVKRASKNKVDDAEAWPNLQKAYADVMQEIYILEANKEARKKDREQIQLILSDLKTNAATWMNAAQQKWLEDMIAALAKADASHKSAISGSSGNNSGYHRLAHLIEGAPSSLGFTYSGNKTAEGTINYEANKDGQKLFSGSMDKDSNVNIDLTTDFAKLENAGVLLARHMVEECGCDQIDFNLDASIPLSKAQLAQAIQEMIYLDPDIDLTISQNGNTLAWDKSNYFTPEEITNIKCEAYKQLVSEDIIQTVTANKDLVSPENITTQNFHKLLVAKLVDNFKDVPFDTKSIDSNVIKAFVGSLAEELSKKGCDCSTALHNVNPSTVLKGVAEVITKPTSDISNKEDSDVSFKTAMGSK